MTSVAPNEPATEHCGDVVQVGTSPRRDRRRGVGLPTLGLGAPFAGPSKFAVAVVDQRGIGLSDITDDGYGTGRRSPGTD
jgi:hypothetical protein